MKLPNNRFNVQAIGYLPFVPAFINRLSKDLVEWLEDRWDEGKRFGWFAGRLMYLRLPTGWGLQQSEKARVRRN